MLVIGGWGEGVILRLSTEDDILASATRAVDSHDGADKKTVVPARKDLSASGSDL